MGDKKDKTDSEDGSDSDSLEIFDDIFGEDTDTAAPETTKMESVPAASPAKETAPKQAQKTEQGPTPSKALPVKKAVTPAQPIKAVPPAERAKPEKKQPSLKPKDASFSDSQDLFDNIFSEGTDAAPEVKKESVPAAPTAKEIAPKQAQKTEQVPVPSKAPPAKKAASPAQPVKTATPSEQAKPVEKQPVSDIKDGSYSEGLKIPEDIVKKGTGAEVPDTKKKTQSPATPPVKTAAATTVKKPEQSPAPQQAPAEKKAPPAQTIKASPPAEQAKPEEKQPGTAPEDESFSESQDLFDSIFSQVVDADVIEAKKESSPAHASPVKAAAPKQVQKEPGLTEPIRKAEQRVVPPKVTPAKEAVQQSPIVKSERSFEPDTYLGKRPDRDEGSGKKEIEKIEIHEKSSKRLNPIIIVSSIIAIVILAMLTGMVIEDRGGIIGSIRTKRDSRAEKEVPARTDKDTDKDKDKETKASAVIDKKPEIKEPDIQVPQQLKEEIPPATDKAPSEVPAQVADKVIPSEEPKTLSYPYSIYLGSYDKIDSVKDLETDYEAMGLSPYWVKADLGERGIWFRLFTNYFQTREEADNFIKTRQVPDAETQKTKYVNLIGTYSSAQEASKQREIIKEMGYCPYIITDNRNTFWLYVGAFNEKDLAEKHNAELMQKGIQSKVVER